MRFVKYWLHRACPNAHGADSGKRMTFARPIWSMALFSFPQAPSSATARGIWQRCKMVKFAGLASSEEIWELPKSWLSKDGAGLSFEA